MITLHDGWFALETARTGCYLALRGGLCENLHYGARVRVENLLPLTQKTDVGYGCDTLYKKELGAVSLEHLSLELSPLQKGDYRAQSLSLVLPNGARTADFAYVCAKKLTGSVPPAGMPGAFGGEETLALTFAAAGVQATLYYTTYPDCDVITRRLSIQNNAEGPVTLEKVMSYQLDLPGKDYTLSTFHGAWARERHEEAARLVAGARVFGSRLGVSSAFVNPFFMLAENGATEFSGGVYGFNLIYSGSHEGCVEVSPYGHTRVMAGIQSDGFSWTLAPGETFDTPEAVMTFSREGKNGMSANMHEFVRSHIVRGAWAKKERPVLLNNWEATYFDFTEKKLLSLAKDAARLGVELFVLDDGWFGERNDDTKGLGDYTVNRKKLPHGLDGLAKRVHDMGLLFGLWLEPEMVNEDSGLFRAHPDWIVAAPGVTPSTGRNQYVLDLCRAEVQDYIIEHVNATLKSAPIDYVKWDMNRGVSDPFSPALPGQGRFFHSYVLGLYRVFSEVTAANPGVLFEGCSSGGGRFDLGVLSYMPQIWTSDDTDAYERERIQTGTSYGYPPSVMGCHVSAAPNHQTLRTSPIETRFNVAAFGVLGYELDVNRLTPAEQKAVAAQIAYYKKHRRLLQYGRFARLASPFDGKNRCEWMVVSDDGSEAIVGEFQHLLVPNTEKPPLRLAYLREDALYEVEARPQVIDIRSFGSLINHLLPFRVNASGHLMHTVADRYMMACEEEKYTAYGDMLMYAGIRQKQSFTGTGYTKDVRILPDFGSRMHFLIREDRSGRA